MEVCADTRRAAVAVLLGIANSLMTPLAGCARRGYATLDV
jgi:hypothetical protein